MVPLFGAAYAAPNKGTTMLYWFRSPKTLLNTPVNSKIQGLFKAFECFSSTFQGKFNFQGLFKTFQYIQVLFKPVQTLDKVCLGNLGLAWFVLVIAPFFSLTGSDGLSSNFLEWKLSKIFFRNMKDTFQESGDIFWNAANFAINVVNK